MATDANDVELGDRVAGGLEYVGFPADAPTTYADNCAFMTSVGATVRSQFVEFVPGAADSTAPGMKVRYVRTMVMPNDGFRAMVSYFNGIIERDTSAETPDVE